MGKQSAVSNVFSSSEIGVLAFDFRLFAFRQTPTSQAQIESGSVKDAMPGRIDAQPSKRL
jgi:hypothetical protein